MLGEVPQRARRVLLGLGRALLDELQQPGNGARLADGVAVGLVGVRKVAQRARRPGRFHGARAALEQRDQRRDAALVADRVAVHRGAEGDGAQRVRRLGGHLGRRARQQRHEPREAVDLRGEGQRGGGAR